MRRSWLFLALFGLSGCTSFDEFYFHDGYVYEAAVDERPCGCSAPPRLLPAPSYAPPTIQNVSGSAPLPQSREPELLR